MNKPIAAVMLAVICLCLAGCKNQEAKDISIDIVSESFTRETFGTTTAATETTETTEMTEEETEATEETDTVASGATAQRTEKKSLATGRVSKSALDDITGTLDTSAKAGSNSIEGHLSFSKSGFTFTPQMGTPLIVNVDSIMLVVVEYEMESQGEKLSLLTADGQYTFMVEDGYCQQLSNYIIIGESQESKSRGVLGYRIQGS